MASINKHATTLADGRELIYFDDADTRLGPDRAIDGRILDARPHTPTMRQDPLTGEWVSIAADRQNRAFLPPADHDPLAPASPSNPSEIPDDYDVAVFENRSPSFGPALDGANSPLGLADLDELGIGRMRTAIGRCEVVCFSPETVGSFGSQSVSRARTVIEAWADRTEALSALPGIQQVFPFENRGEAIGVTLHHPHGQIYAYPYITPRTRQLIASVERMPELFSQLLAFELESERVVLRGEHWSAFVPFAARWPLEVHMLPHRQVPDLAATSDAERDELAILYRMILRGIDRIYDSQTPDSTTPYIAAWHQAPVASHRNDIRLMLQVTSPRRAADKLKYLAGSEAAMGAWVSDVTPEHAAELVRAGIAAARADS
ncbi:UDPglucose--hexose-1-phosphate uridylyltransferase [Cryobacterium mesophilum]|uniref:Galactose-1-phosphate uridylyltransferase n=1 Tax=Terrimesophilobacter mesophilus TaxID=433647 RepID=A0A4R8VCP4_9MICO|nr:galactose-1-phosphate uridylyltransferase [Terrimesophilobacter mesophilus]MBB5632809.1 UDPglucose--hexose-1-phosphate uridylyltransferase [Terrimesophilobacter mesophilus]TFB79597.1 galactose-1-phosphate uridylyltransferase [Terrimesophilobacter mesophilus]